jgi:hypothetical protein
MKLTVTKKEDVSFSFKSPKLESSKIELVYYLGPKEQRLEITHLKTENGLTTFTTNFKITGFYDVHLKFENDIVASYVVNVKRS